jgi:hypothetical protein
VSSYALALPFALAALSACASARERRSAASYVLVALGLACSLALNPLVGGFAGVCAALWLVPELLTGTWRARFSWGGAAAGAALLALPFLLPATNLAPRGASMTGDVALGGHPVSNLLGPLVLLALPAALGLRILPSHARNRFLVVAVLAAGCVLAGEMPQGNEYKMARLSGLVWALPAGAWASRALARCGAGRFAVAGLVLLSLPTTIAVPWAYLAYGARAPALPLAIEDGRLAPRVAGVRFLFEAEASEDPRSVVVMPPSFPGAMAAPGLVQGNALAPALRHALFADLPQIHNDRNEDLARRLELLEAVYGIESALEPSTALARMRSEVVGRPLLVFDDGLAAEPARSLSQAGAKVVARSGDLALWSLSAAAP